MEVYEKEIVYAISFAVSKRKQKGAAIGQRKEIYWYFADIRYTPFFDCNNKRIAQNDSVIYYGRLYSIHLLDVEEHSVFIEEKRECRKKEWYLSKSNGGIICKEILLEDAVRDEKGKIKVYEYGMGEKG